VAKKFMKKSSPAPQARTRSAHKDWEVKSLDTLRVDGGTQSRVMLDEEVASEYAERMSQDPHTGLILDTEGEPWPPLVAFFDGKDHWLVDGFHRLRAAKLAELTGFQLDVKPGEMRDAIRLSLSVNAKHGLRRTREDKRRSVERALADDEWVSYSDRKLAQLCAVSPRTIATVRKELEAAGSIEEQTERVGVDGSVQDVSATVVSQEVVVARKKRTTAKKKLDRAGLDTRSNPTRDVLEAARLDSLAGELEKRSALVLMDGAGKVSVSAVLDHLPALLAEDGVLITPVNALLSLPGVMARLHEDFGQPSSAVLEGSREVVLVYSRRKALEVPSWTDGLGSLMQQLAIDAPHLISL
jgi:DNA-binding transcriptional regulator YhcF (GntR family)